MFCLIHLRLSLQVPVPAVQAGGNRGAGEGRVEKRRRWPEEKDYKTRQQRPREGDETAVRTQAALWLRLPGQVRASEGGDGQASRTEGGAEAGATSQETVSPAWRGTAASVLQWMLTGLSS